MTKISHQSLAYRPDIDGLRALAILPVLWFHSGLPGLSGGFTGVDTFFVISGFLITGIIHREIGQGRFTFSGFYERRARRIGPALLTVIGATLAMGAVLLLPSELEKLGESSLAALFMVPNIYFWMEAGYFRLGEGITPLLHTWSLGVEEQFYLFFPFALILAHRFNILRATLWAVLIGSFALSVAATLYAPAASFYLLPTRAWEMALGGILAVGLVRVPASWQSAGGIAGMILLVLSAVFITKQMPFPGWVALLPCLGAGLIIASGPDHPSGRILSHPILVWIGKISYSLYLWHWPVFVYLRHYNASVELSVAESVFGVGVSTLLAWLTYQFVEQPARQKTMGLRKVMLGLSAGIIVISAVAIALITSKGFPQRLSDNVLAWHQQENDHGPFSKTCVWVSVEDASDQCQIGQGQARVAIWGDSHAAAVLEGTAEGLAMPTISLSRNTCPPALDWHNPAASMRGDSACSARNRAVIDYIRDHPDIETIILAAYWPTYDRMADAQASDAVWLAVQESVDTLVAMDRRVIILAGTPEPGAHVPWRAAIEERYGRPRSSWPCPPAKVPVKRATIADLSQNYCDHPDPRLLFTDNNHPSLTANREVIGPALQKLKATP